MALDFSELRQISIVDYLGSQGYHPRFIRGNNYWYHSPFRIEKQPSFKVNHSLNVWYDHGVGQGGSILDLGARLNQCSIYTFACSLAGHALSSIPPIQSRFEKPAENRILITDIRPLRSENLISYLSSRGIELPLGRKYCVEVEAKIGSRKHLVIGFQNRSNGWELRNAVLKLSSSPKDISYINNGNRNLCVMEGFIDFLSALAIDDARINSLTIDASFLVLNSVSLIKRGVDIIKQHGRIVTFLDNDEAGKKALQELKDIGLKFENAAHHYSKHKDLNDFLLSKKGIGIAIGKSRGPGR